MRISISIGGVDELLAALDALGDVSALENGLAQAAHLVEEEAKAMCPVRTGNLRSSITSSADGLHAEVGTDCPYAAFVEFGTYRSAAKPYLVPAMLAARDAVAAAVANSIKAVSG